MQLFNSHVHTDVSPDCQVPASEMASAAYSSSLAGIAFCDHCSALYHIAYRTYNKAKTSTDNARKLAEKYRGKMDVFRGIEFEEMIWDLKYSKKILSSFEFDVVLASVHRVKKCITKKYFSRIDFSKFSTEDIYDYAKHYFDDVLETAKECDYDVLSHITILERYIIGKYGLEFDRTRFMPIIDEILKVVIDRGKALEVNTSETHRVGLMPDKEILLRYKALGGNLVTIGTDAHQTQCIANGFDAAINTLRECGFDYYVYYKNRQIQKEYI